MLLTRKAKILLKNLRGFVYPIRGMNPLQAWKKYALSIISVEKVKRLFFAILRVLSSVSVERIHHKRGKSMNRPVMPD